jgi:hypothetical protein
MVKRGRKAKSDLVPTGKNVSSNKRQNKGKTEKKEEVTVDYSSKDYWNQRYTPKQQSSSTAGAETDGNILDHEWYYSFQLLSPLIHQTLVSIFQKPKSTTLIPADVHALEVGCGNKPLITSFTSFQTNEKTPLLTLKNLMGIDYAEKVIEQLKEENKDYTEENDKKADIQFEAMDARHLPKNWLKRYDFIIEKGTIDAMLSESDKKKGLKNAKQILSEMVRCLSEYGAIMIISHIEVDSDEYEVFHELLCEALTERPIVNWKVISHSVNQGEGEEANRQAVYGTVYVIHSYERKETRAKYSSSCEISFEYLEYSDNEDEGDGEDDGFDPR